MSTEVTESLTCPKCEHVVVTAKSIGRGDTCEIDCPKCKSRSSLGEWRFVHEPGESGPVEFEPVQKALKKPKPSVLSMEVGGCLHAVFFIALPGTVALLGILGGLARGDGQTLLGSLILLMLVAILEKLVSIDNRLAKPEPPREPVRPGFF